MREHEKTLVKDIVSSRYFKVNSKLAGWLPKENFYLLIGGFAIFCNLDPKFSMNLEYIIDTGEEISSTFPEGMA